MITTKTPYRISFVGGGSDMEEFYKNQEGAVLSTTINKYMYISSHHFFDTDQVRVKYSRTETVTNIQDLRHPIVREVLQKFNIKGALEISSNGDAPSGTGLGSSSAFTVGLLHNLYARQGSFVAKDKLAGEACDIEINKLKEPIGKQDQYACACGGLNIFRFSTNGDVLIEPIHLRREVYKTLQNNLLLFYTGEQRSTSSILSEQKNNLQQSADKVETLKKMVALVWELRDCLYKGDLHYFGELLHKNWILKRQLASKVSTSEIDALYDKALENGAVGGKVLGAGGGGFLLLYCEPQNHAKLRQAFTANREMLFKFENEGTKLIYAGDEYI